MRVPLNEPYTITNDFGVPDSRAAFGRHAGIDYGVATGRTVYAPMSGRVTDYVWGRYHGNTVQIFDGQNYHRLMHNSQLLVSPGQNVAEGTAIAKSGATGEGITGPHVHHDISPQKIPTSFNFINPATYGKEESMKTNRGEAIRLERFITMNHTPTEAQIKAATGKELEPYLADRYNDGDFLKNKDIVKVKYPTAVKQVLELTKAVEIKDKEIARLNAIQGNAGKWETITTLLKQILGIG